MKALLTSSGSTLPPFSIYHQRHYGCQVEVTADMLVPSQSELKAYVFLSSKKAIPHQVLRAGFETSCYAIRPLSSPTPEDPERELVALAWRHGMLGLHPKDRRHDWSRSDF